MLFYELPADERMMASDVDLTFPPTYIVLRFSKRLKPKTLLWFLNRVIDERKKGGAELLISLQPQILSQGTVAHVSVTQERILETAEELELRKVDKGGLVKEFLVKDVNSFLYDSMTVDDLFTTAERQTIVRHELENLRGLADDHNLPGYPNITLYEGQSLFQLFLKHGFIKQCYPLHDKEALKKLGQKWYRTLYRRQPFEDIRQYFGEHVALYFIFLGFYTTALLPSCVLGLLELFIPQTTTVFFCLFNVVWVTLFLLMYCVSLPIVFICLAIAFIIMLVAFRIESQLIEDTKNDEVVTLLSQVIVMVPSVTYAGLVYVMNLYYRKLATYLTEWENHRTQSQFDRHRVTKLVLFEFTNNFMSMFYIAFVIQDMEMLKFQLATMLIILQAINNFQETLLPLLIRCYGSKVSSYVKYNRLFTKRSDSISSLDTTASSAERQSDPLEILSVLPELSSNDERIVQAESEALLENYEGTYDDYLEMFIQFGYVFLFSAVYPMAAFWAVLNNFLEIRSDAFKLCKVCQRPMPRRVKDIGAWQKAFEAVGVLSIMTNCGLMCISPQLHGLADGVSSVEWVLIFVFLEHLLLAINYLLNATISDKTEWVRIQLAKANYQSKQVLKYKSMEKHS